jgi:hypothetical protein
VILARPGPVFPRGVSGRQFEVRRLAGVIRVGAGARLIRPVTVTHAACHDGSRPDADLQHTSLGCANHSATERQQHILSPHQFQQM